jgi:hypothetical protein
MDKKIKKITIEKIEKVKPEAQYSIDKTLALAMLKVGCGVQEVAIITDGLV